jgi:hypothetical protein
VSGTLSMSADHRMIGKKNFVIIKDFSIFTDQTFFLYLLVISLVTDLKEHSTDKTRESFENRPYIVLIRKSI